MIQGGIDEVLLVGLQQFVEQGVQGFQLGVFFELVGGLCDGLCKSDQMLVVGRKFGGGMFGGMMYVGYLYLWK